MKEITFREMAEISAGADDNVATRLAAAALGSITYAVWGTLIGGVQSGTNGGVLGFGLIGNAVGAIWGFIAGGMTGAAMGVSIGWDKTVSMVETSFTNLFNGQFVPWAQ